MHIASRGGFDWGKLLLGVFRIVMVGFIGWLMHHLCTKRQDTPKGVIVGLALIFAGAMGNILDSAFYGLIFSESTPYTVAQFGGHYAGFMMGKVVDISRCSNGTAYPACCGFWSTATTISSARSSIWPMPTSRWQSSICFCFSTSSSASRFFLKKELVFQKKVLLLHTAIPEMPRWRNR